MRGAGLSLLLFLFACGEADHPRPPRQAEGVVLPGGNIDRRAYLGRLLYLRHCVVCHGAEGAGDGFNSYSLDPKPRDLRGVVAELGEDHVRLVILDGSAAASRSALCPPRRKTLLREEPELVLAFLRTLEPAPAD